MSKKFLGSRRWLCLLTAGVVTTGVMATLPTATAAEGQGLRRVEAKVAPDLTPGNYIVLVNGASATGYSGGTKGLPATRSAEGRAFNGRSARVKAYQRHLVERHKAVARGVDATVRRHYTIAANGFAARLTAQQAIELSRDRRVQSVTPDTERGVDTWNTPTFLGLAGKKGAWRRYAGSRAKAGDGIVIGDLDTGIWPESRSFRGEPLTRKQTGKWDLARYGQTVRMEKRTGGLFKGRCQLSAVIDGVSVPAEKWDAGDCNQKLIAARYYPDAFVANVPPEDRAASEQISTRDGDSHGTHTASTAAGNAGIVGFTEDVRFGRVSGMAPAAKIAAYKVCWEDNDPDTGGCYNSAILAAIDDAVTDGVDVINFSISGAEDTVVDPVEIAFEGAAEAGIFVAASAGNSGPGASTVAHNSPWVTTVAASTSHSYENTVVLGNGKRFRGASITKRAVPSTRLVYSGDVGIPAGVDASLCGPDSLDPAKVTGRIVLCDRGKYARVDKSAEVKRAGGIAMVLGNVTPGSLDADFHAVPTIHISDSAYPVVKAYLASAGVTAAARFELGDTTGKASTPVPQIAGFSSRGPAGANDGDLLKPDIAAPGVSILAAVSPAADDGRKFDLLSGTSMSAPHIAGIAAFMLGAHPRWTPMQIKSAMMTTARSLKDEAGERLRDPFAQGSGNVRPKKAFNPGLFVTSDALQWKRFLQGQGLSLGVSVLDASDLNGPSIADGALAGARTYKRTFTATMKGRWKVTAWVRGFRIDVRRAVRSTRVGDLLPVAVKATRTTAPYGQYATGYLKLTGPTTVRVPIALRPVALETPAVVRGTGATGSTAVTVKPGFTGEQGITTTGLAKALSVEDAVPQGDYLGYCVEISAGTSLARFDLDAAQDNADLDLSVYPADAGCSLTSAEPLGVSATASADESIDLVDPAAGNVVVFVDGYEAAPGETLIPFRLDFYDVDASATAGSLTVTPNPVPLVAGQATSFDISWTGLDGGSRYLGWLDYDGTDLRTDLYVDVAPIVP